MSDESPPLSTDEIASILRRRRRPKKSAFRKAIIALCRWFREHSRIILIILSLLSLFGLVTTSVYVVHNLEYFLNNSHLVVLFALVPTVGLYFIYYMSERTHEYHHPELYEGEHPGEDASPSSASEALSDTEERVTLRRHAEEPSGTEERVTRRRHAEEPSGTEERVTRRRRSEEPSDTERRATRPRRRRKR